MKGRDIISINELSLEEIGKIIKRAKEMVPIAKSEKVSKELDGKILSTMFVEASTRTRLSFETAMLRLGGQIIGFSDPSGSSLKKGESLADTIRMVDGYSDAIVLRHPKEGAAKWSAEVSKVPVINAGDGAGQHPTQTLLDLYTINDKKGGGIGSQHITLVGDLKYGRTVHSLSYALARYGAEISFVSPKALQMPGHVISTLKEYGAKISVYESLEDVIDTTDVIYATRIQKERFPDMDEYMKVEKSYRITREFIEKGKKDLIIMHPLPRVHEIDTEVDEMPNAVYFEQAFNGVPVRMAILSLLIRGE